MGGMARRTLMGTSAAPLIASCSPSPAFIAATMRLKARVSSSMAFTSCFLTLCAAGAIRRMSSQCSR